MKTFEANVNNLNVGDRVYCQWGQWRVNAKITRITRNKTVYAARWIKKNQCWSSPRKIEVWRGMWARA